MWLLLSLTLNCFRFSVEINGIVKNALKEQELEIQFFAIEEEWSEQVGTSITNLQCNVSGVS